MTEGVYFSIIMPTLNSGSTIRASLDSIFKQTFSDFEVLVIDAGSQDCTEQICNTYDGRLKFLRLPDAKQGKARSFGIAESIGRYVMFLDSDDQLSDVGVLADCSDYTKENRADVFNFSARFLLDGKVVKSLVAPRNKQVFNNKQALKLALLGKFVHTVPWNKIYSKKFLQEKKVTFPEINEQEDMVFTIQSMIEAESVFFCDRNIVDAESRPGSLSRKMSRENARCCLEVFDLVEDLLKKGKLFDEFERYFFLYRSRTVSYVLFRSIFRIENDDEFEQAKDYFQNFLKISLRDLVFAVGKVSNKSLLGMYMIRSPLLVSSIRASRKIVPMTFY